MDFRRHQNSLDLSDEWSFAYSEGPPEGEFRSREELKSAGYSVYRCTVPGNFELDLYANGIIGDPFFGMNMAGLTKYERSHVWYFRTFEAQDKPGYEAQLVFDGLDCFADIYLNGEPVASTDNMLIEHVVNVTGRLVGKNELVVHIRPAVEEAKKFEYPPSVGALGDFLEALYVRKAPHMYGWDIMPRAVSAGIWRPVRLRYVPIERLDRVFLENAHVAADGRSANLTLHYTLVVAGTANDSYEVAVEGVCGESRFEAKQRAGAIGGRMPIHVCDPKLWWVRGRGEPNLYEVAVTLSKNGSEIDRLTFTHGIKVVELVRTSTTDMLGSGEFCFKLNGEKVFVLGTNWVPVDAYHSRDVDRLPRILEMVEDIGCNMIRCWGGNVYENDQFYDYCDRRGIMVWQDFAMACAYPPQDEEHRKRIAWEVRAVVRRLRQHACLALWCGDNEIDVCLAAVGRDPNQNVLTRKVIPDVLREEDWVTPYIPSSPFIDEEAFRLGRDFVPENHPWGPRDYYKGDYYKNVLCHFASEIGYHGCPSPESIRQFISPGKIWPYQDNEEWLLHSTSPIPGVNLFDYRVELMAKQVRELFGTVPDNLDDFAFASQASQAEAMKFFIEMFRTGKWRRTGIIWWNLMDGWPQFSDAVVDYYFRRKLAYDFIKRAQQPLLLALREPHNWQQDLVACNDTRSDLDVAYRVTDADTGEVVAEGIGSASADSVSLLARIPWSAALKRFYLIEWNAGSYAGTNHYLLGSPPFNLDTYRRWIHKAGLRETLSEEDCC